MKRVLVLAVVMALAIPAAADWYPEDPCKWVQFPDLAPTGMDVNTSFPYYILADDFLCTQTGPITDIHIWGSWYHDYLPGDVDPYGVMFRLSIHADIPAGVGGIDYSRPGELLWLGEFHGPSGQFVAQIWEEGIDEGWFEPPDSYEFPGDHVCWQYNFFIDEAEAFIQEGTPDNPIVYWLDVQAEPLDGLAWFGWKTSLDHWNDDAVYGPMGEEPYLGPWYELIYPPEHEMAGQSIDLAFVITTLEHDELDWGDAPDPTYPTYGASNGAHHLIVPGVYMGASIDGELDGQPHPNALGDDLAGIDDEDGVAFVTPFIPGTTATVNITVSQTGYIDAWFDWNADGSWTGEQALFSYYLTTGTTAVPISVPASATPGRTTFARFRYSLGGALSEYGFAPEGEVEDYEVQIGLPDTDWGDAPDFSYPHNYPTFNASGGASHTIVPGYQMGAQIDAEPDGQPNFAATGDDLAGVDDEDGVTFVTGLIIGNTATVRIDMTGTAAGGFIDAWVDFGFDGSWAQAGDQIIMSGWAPGGVFTDFNFTVPAGGTVGCTFARFRMSSYGGLVSTGGATDGEVEDLEVCIDEDFWKWQQLPDTSETGIDVNCTLPFILADDFLCEEPGRLTTIRIYASWRNDYLPFGGDPSAVDFVLSIHEDIPAGVGGIDYSRPGEVLWMNGFPAHDPVWTADVWLDGIEEGWMDPPDAYIFPGDWTCWMYSFQIPPEDAFHQTGMPDEPIVYWLDVQASPLDPDAYFGWKTTLDHWNDDAVWAIGMEPYAGPWNELRYPTGHPLSPESIDLAFELEMHYGTGVDETEIPLRSGLGQNVPNPFNPKTSIAYEVPANGCHVAIDIIDVSGRVVRQLVSEFQEEGRREVVWDGRDDDGHELSSGVYFYKLVTPESEATRKMLLLK
ncbi:MAG: GEVED domain-containing protein [Candidatus Eisenbacteria bacterium]|nr:GEVED domain-containing protein [Candidatus Eisenbacteria bacterium]